MMVVLWLPLLMVLVAGFGTGVLMLCLHAVPHSVFDLMVIGLVFLAIAIAVGLLAVINAVRMGSRIGAVEDAYNTPGDLPFPPGSDRRH